MRFENHSAFFSPHVTRRKYWRLQYLDYEGENERACTLSEVVDDLCTGYLSAVAVENVRRLLWYLSRCSGDVCRTNVSAACPDRNSGTSRRKKVVSGQQRSSLFQIFPLKGRRIYQF